MLPQTWIGMLRMHVTRPEKFRIPKLSVPKSFGKVTVDPCFGFPLSVISPPSSILIFHSPTNDIIDS